jgi:hypothetical protein
LTPYPTPWAAAKPAKRRPDHAQDIGRGISSVGTGKRAPALWLIQRH